VCIVNLLLVKVEGETSELETYGKAFEKGGTRHKGRLGKGDRGAT